MNFLSKIFEKLDKNKAKSVPKVSTRDYDIYESKINPHEVIPSKINQDAPTSPKGTL